MKHIFYCLILISNLIFISCKDDPIGEKKGNIKFGLQYFIDNDTLKTDTIIYTNAAGNKYSINHFEYFLSGFSFQKNDNSWHTTDNVFYVNIKKTLTNTISLNNIPYGDYKSVTFYLGLDSIRNQSNYLPNTIENINMAWPDAMGGGYHFIKLEGYFLDKSGTKQDGYAMHLGTNKNLIKIEINHPFSINANSLDKKLIMNINEWFKNPLNYDFDIDGNYSMGVDGAMSKLAQNGKDLFKIE
ncbi:MAG: hypothetical protein HUU47_00345 [Bacteroidetes bacterium]|nr:hypothetical protein [Bacteroidota bacterium]